MALNTYYNTAALDAAVRAGKHREVIGGLWEQLGQLQLDFMISRGLKPEHRVLDIGCGSLRAGVKLIRYLDAGNYFGTDLDASLLQAGYDVELVREGLVDKLPRSNLVTDGEFDFSWVKQPFDFALAQSVFTHLPLNHMRVCLEKLVGAVRDGGRFYMTFFEIPADHPTGQPFAHEPGGIVSKGAADPYHYRLVDVEFAAAGLPWECRYIGEWNHPRSQRMIEFVRTN
jgi:SAM-dependent methyltransferase